MQPKYIIVVAYMQPKYIIVVAYMQPKYIIVVAYMQPKYPEYFYSGTLRREEAHTGNTT